MNWNVKYLLYKDLSIGTIGVSLKTVATMPLKPETEIFYCTLLLKSDIHCIE